MPIELLRVVHNARNLVNDEPTRESKEVGVRLVEEEVGGTEAPSAALALVVTNSASALAFLLAEADLDLRAFGEADSAAASDLPLAAEGAVLLGESGFAGVGVAARFAAAITRFAWL